MLLAVERLTVRYGKALAVEEVTLGVEQGTIVVVVGANGAGKTTILRVISGLLPPTSGEVWFAGRRIDGMQAYQVARAGIIHVPEGRHLFPQMTVQDNLKTGGVAKKGDLGTELRRFTRASRFSVRNGTRKPRVSAAVSSRCSPSAAPSWLARRFSSSMSRASALRPSSSTSSIQLSSDQQDGVSMLLAEQNVSLALRLG